MEFLLGDPSDASLGAGAAGGGDPGFHYAMIDVTVACSGNA
jgi:hypothetical protein